MDTFFHAHNKTATPPWVLNTRQFGQKFEQLDVIFSHAQLTSLFHDIAAVAQPVSLWETQWHAVMEWPTWISTGMHDYALIMISTLNNKCVLHSFTEHHHLKIVPYIWQTIHINIHIKTIKIMNFKASYFRMIPKHLGKEPLKPATNWVLLNTQITILLFIIFSAQKKHVFLK